ncbi:beta-lactamase [Staphylotrichum tortipilum]|uniref:Beta-lactamase n=1 Tax=Staphylotrichum tortipilum TaxID=2831512 RepID=A0AAN6MEW4_9PEZI|nr:beta-lactamase [Staphylotrichum longicolle]
MTKTHGTYDPAFSRLAELLSKLAEDGSEVGASVSVWHGSDNLVEIWTGYADPAKTRPWNQDTIANVFSCTKTICALAVLMLHDRGLLSVFDPVAKHWPEFAANGKENVLIAHLMSHTSGVSAWDEPITLEQVYDTQYATAKLAEQKPWWTPGTASGYHGQNQGQLLGEVVRRVSGKSLKEFVRTEIAEPLGADVQIGALEKDWHRCAEVIPPVLPPMPQIDPNGLPFKMMTNPPLDAGSANTPAWRLAELGAINGHSNAQGLAKALHVISNGGKTPDGRQFLKKETVDLIFQIQAEGTDLVLEVPLCMGIGFGLSSEEGAVGSIPFMPKGKVAFWGGWGGSICILDVGNNVTLTYAMNKMGEGTLGNERTAQLAVEAYEALKEKGIVKR